MIRDPTALPFRTMSCPFAFPGNSVCARPVTTSGYTRPSSAVVSTVMRTAVIKFLVMFMMPPLSLTRPAGRLREADRGDDDVDDLDPDEWDDDAACSIQEEVSPKERFCA